MDASLSIAPGQAGGYEYDIRSEDFQSNPA